MIRSSVDVFDHFPEITAAVDELARQAVAAAATEAAQTAAQIAAARSVSGTMEQIQALPVAGGEQGWVAGIKSAAWYAGFQSYGTLGRRKPPAKQPGRKRSHAAGTGIEPLRFFQKARTAGRRAMLKRVLRGL